MKRLWILFGLVLVVSFAVLGWVGTRIYQEMPPIPDKVVTPDGKAVIDSGEIAAGQNVWQALGGMEVGSVWGHGSYVAPDWTADYLHREAVFILDRWAEDEFGSPFDELDEEHQGQLTARLSKQFRENKYDAESGTLTIEPLRAEAFAANVDHYSAVFHRRQRRLCDTCRRRQRFRPRPQIVGFLFLVVLVGGGNSAGRQCKLHQQLAARAAGRQPPNGRQRGLDRRQHHHVAGRHFGDGLVVCFA